MTPQHVGDLPHQQAHVIPVERNLRELEQRLPADEARRQGFRRRLDPWRRDPALHAADGFDEIDLEAGGRGQLGLALGDRFELEDVPRKNA